MKKALFLFLALTAFVLSFSSCATVVGGAKYNARVRVPDHPNAKITINGRYQGNGEASMLVPRKDANQLSVTVQDGDDEPQTTVFNGRKFRAGTLVFDLLFFWIPPIPAGVIVDAAAGAWWKPDENEPGVSKIDVDNYQYIINYKPNTKPTSPPIPMPIPKEPATTTTVDYTITPPSVTPSNPLMKTKTEALRELKQLLDEGILTQEEYDKEKAKLLESN